MPGESSQFGRVANLGPSTSDAIAECGRVANSANAGAGDIVEGIEMLQNADALLPVVTSSAELLSGIDHQIVEGIFNRAEKVRDDGQLERAGEVTVRQIEIIKFLQA